MRLCFWQDRSAADAAGPASVPSCRSPTVRLFWLWLAGHVLVWTLVPLACQPNAPLDMIEMLSWGREWELGYHKHPPLPAWIAEAAAVLTGNSIWGLYLASQLAAAASFWAAWRLAGELVSPWPALCAAMLLESCYYYNFCNADLNNNTVARPFWALAVLFLYHAMTAGQMRHWLATGVCLALGMLSKYDAAFLALSMLLFAYFNSRARQALRTPGPYCAIAVALLLFAPHLWWMCASDFITIRYALERSESTGGLCNHLVNPLGFLVSQAGALFPMLVLALPLTGRRWKLRPLDRRETFQRDFLLTMVLGPLALYMLASTLLGIHIHSMWGSPLWTFAGVAVVFCLQVRRAPAICRGVALRCAAMGVVFALALISRNVFGPYVRNKPSRIHFPGQPLAEEVTRRWERQHHEPLSLVAGSWWEAGNVSFYLRQRPSVYGELSQLVSPWASDQRLAEQGGVILWEFDPLDLTTEAELRRRFPQMELQPPISLKWRTFAPLPPKRIGIAIIDPSPEDPEID